MMGFVRIAMGLSILCLSGALAAAEEQVPANTPWPKDGSCLHHTLADKDIVVKLKNGEKYDDRYAKSNLNFGTNAHGTTMPLHTFLCTNGRLTQVQ